MSLVNQFDTSSTGAALPSKPVSDPPGIVDASIGQLPTQIIPTDRRLTAAEFQGLAEVPPEFEWFENLKNPGTKRIYKNAIRDFMRFTGIVRPEEFRIVTRAHVIAWRDDLERRQIGRATKRNPAGCTIRNRLAALSSLFEYLCGKNAVPNNPVKGVKRPKTQSGEGATPTIGDHQARQLLAAPAKDTVKAKRDRAILSTLLFHALRREELCKLKVRISGTRAAASRTSKSRARAKKFAMCLSIPEPTPSSTITSRPRATAATTLVRCSVQLKTIGPRP
jgi:hypothetical protein